MNKKIRPPAVAGAFYPNDRDALLNEIHGYLAGVEGDGEPDKVMAVISPHAGWYYSGHVAGAVFGAIAVPDKVILIGPNHRGVGVSVALDNPDGWLFPFGVVPIDKEMCASLLENSETMESDAAAHAWEHSLEVIVPFLFARNPKISIAAICTNTHDMGEVEEIAVAVAKTAKKFGALLVASTDMTHYMPDEAARKADHKTIDVIKTMDEKALMARVVGEGALCGGPAVAILLSACKKNGAKKINLVRYATSGDIEGKRSSVVGYGGFTVPV